MNRYRDRDPDRRREERVTGTGLRARVRPGYRVLIIDLSCAGALVEVRRPLRPGSYVDLHLESEARGAMVAARVVRCAVAAIDAERGVTYRAGLCFNESCDWVRESLVLLPRVPDEAPTVSAEGTATREQVPTTRATGRVSTDTGRRGSDPEPSRHWRSSS